MFKSMSDVTGQCFVHKTQLDVKSVEIARSLKLSKDKLIPITWTIPRKRVRFVFCTTAVTTECDFTVRSLSSSKTICSQRLGQTNSPIQRPNGLAVRRPLSLLKQRCVDIPGADKDVELVSLQPPGMSPLSQAPKEVRLRSSTSVCHVCLFDRS